MQYLGSSIKQSTRGRGAPVGLVSASSPSFVRGARSLPAPASLPRSRSLTRRQPLLSRPAEKARRLLVSLREGLSPALLLRGTSFEPLPPGWARSASDPCFMARMAAKSVKITRRRGTLAGQTEQKQETPCSVPACTAFQVSPQPSSQPYFPFSCKHTSYPPKCLTCLGGLVKVFHVLKTLFSFIA